MGRVVAASAAVHVTAALAFVISVAAGAPVRVDVALGIGFVVTLGWLVWLRAEQSAAEMSRPPVRPVPVAEPALARRVAS